MTIQVIILCGIREKATFVEQFAAAGDGWLIEFFENSLSVLGHLRKYSADVIIVSMAGGRFKDVETFIRFYDAVSFTPILMSGTESQRGASEVFVACGAQGFISSDPKDRIAGVQIIRDLNLRFRLHRQLERRAVRAEITLNAIGDGVIGADTDGNVDYINPAAEILTGWSSSEAKGQPIIKVMPIDIDDSLGDETHPVHLALQKRSAAGLSAGAVLLKRDGSRVDIEDSVAPIIDYRGNLTGAVVVFHDVSEERAMKVKITYLAEHDYLTQLPNRVLFQDRLEQAVRGARRDNQRLAVMFIDLDNFKYINDSLGHAVGDQLLFAVAAALTRSVRASDTVSRQGGDEFVVLLPALQVEDNVEVIAKKILQTISAGHQVNGSTLYISASIGISFFPSDAFNVEDLIKHADTALYDAKVKGRNRYQFFRPTMNAKAVERQVIEADLRCALSLGQFLLYYQPKVDLSSGRITGVEALVRWSHPREGMIVPARFIGIAEDSRLIIPIGDWVMRTACQQIKQWDDQGLKNICVAVNVSTIELLHTGYVDNILAILKETGIAPGALQLELTESALMADLPFNRQVLLRLKAAGLSLALDDFGTGYSSLAYLTQLPFDVLKIDQSFIRHVNSRADNSAVVAAILAMGKSLQHCVVAEGIEDSLELGFLQSNGCQEGQGYLFSQPLSEPQITNLLLTGSVAISA
ncbi:putative bifunctional diguanylate cyclase/phosphodiesterase [Pseudomonas syringae group genomosp. 3]|uniref:cyclic-guanylate-specific phosphodiesterase n=1 Tax=Pseudomonas syringae pv. viburni TaxID=251703 RepID=A0A0Q0DLX1_9PSED|nr:EAL domain-containing protein [Pseudomonas syringae group genomosp. 3]KPZ08659.1 Response regulator receiver modulated diguanylate cye/phosphodiesterase with PAS/PAC sensor [Pseudomonas syringae pv. viburni]